MTAKAISFTPEVLKAKLRVLEEYGHCQTRRPLTARHVGWLMANEQSSAEEIAPWKTGQSLWVRGRARVLEFAHGASGPMVRLAYEVDGVASQWLPYPTRLKEPVVGHCIPNGVHREGARHFLEVVEVRAERVSEISEQDALLEGMEGPSEWLKTSFFALYDSIYGDGAHARDWCWVYTLKRAMP